MAPNNLKRIFFLSSVVSLVACSSGGDYTEDLGGGFFYRSGGGDIHDIQGGRVRGEVPANILSCVEEGNWVFALQKPAAYEEPLYTRKYHYPRGKDEKYYWTLNTETQIISGPLDSSVFVRMYHQATGSVWKSEWPNLYTEL